MTSQSETDEPSIERESVRAGQTALIPLTPGSDHEWEIHLQNSTYISTFSRVTQQSSGGFHCWANGTVVLFIDEDDSHAPEEIREKLAEIAENT